MTDGLLALYTTCLVALSSAGVWSASQGNYGAAAWLGATALAWLFVVFHRVRSLIKEAEVKAYEDGLAVGQRGKPAPEYLVDGIE
jgi:hypothetical protein